MNNNNFSVPFTPQPITFDELGQGRIFTLRGPRQVGKTTFLKRLKETASSLNPIYESLDIVRTDRELVSLVRGLIKQHNSKLILLDEISSVPRWQKAFKYLIDKEEIKDIDFILSGSSATDIKRGAERLPGRRGPEVENGWDRVLLPLSFSQFVKHTAILTNDEIEFVEANADNPKRVPNELHSKLSNAFIQFMSVGGFPTAIFSKQNGLNLPFRTMMAIIRSDFEKRKKSRIILDQVLSRINAITGSAVTWETFTKSVTATKVISRQYVDELCENYLLLDVECFDLGRNQRSPRKPRKFLWIDPLIGMAITEDGMANSINEASAVESIVGFELARRFEKNLWEGLNQLRHVYLWRDSRGNEVDFIVHGKTMTAIEVKWQNQISAWDVKTIQKTFGGGILLSKNQFEKFDNTTVMPVYWFLLQLNKYLSFYFKYV